MVRATVRLILMRADATVKKWRVSGENIAKGCEYGCCFRADRQKKKIVLFLSVEFERERKRGGSGPKWEHAAVRGAREGEK